MFEYLHDNLVIHTKIYYSLQRGKRVYSDNITEPLKAADTVFEFEAHLYPPLLLLPITWQRYGYTYDDVNKTYDKIDASFVWAISLLLLASVYEPESSSAGVRSTFQSLFTFLFISRKTVFDVFISSQSDYISKSNKSILCVERDDHKPLLPKVHVSRAQYENCKAAVPVRPPSFCWYPHYNELIQFKDIYLVPVEYDAVNQLVYMVRVVDKRVYDAIEVKPKLCVVTMPLIATVGPNKIEHIMLEEACFFSIQLVEDISTNIVGKNGNASKKRGRKNEINPIPTKKRKVG